MQVVTLPVIHPDFLERLQGGLVLDELRYARDFQGLGDLRDGNDDGVVVLVVHHVAHETAIDLQVVHRQHLEIAEGAEAAAEIVERELAPHFLQFRHEAGGMRHVANGGGFGDLEGDQAWVDAAAQDFAFDEIEQIFLSQ